MTLAEPPIVPRLPKGIRNSNPGNLRFNPRVVWRGQVGQDKDGFCVFEDMRYGVRAACKVLLTGFRKQGEDTVREIISNWAPSTENDTAAYIDAVCAAMKVGPDDLLTTSQDTLFALLKAIFRHENGAFMVHEDTIRKGIEEALA